MFEGIWKHLVKWTSEILQVLKLTDRSPAEGGDE